MIGTMKFILTTFVGYHNHVSEYGIHWNFFITLAIVQIICGIFSCKLGMNRNFIAFLAVLTSIGYEIWLQNSEIYQWIFSLKEDQRLTSGFVIANIEGFVSLLGYSSLFLFGASLKETIYRLNEKSNWKKTSVCTLILWSLFIFSINEGYLILPSRRLCNFSYIIWMVGYNLTIILLFAGIQILTGKHIKFNCPYFFFA